jgi:hypothetical protein
MYEYVYYSILQKSTLTYCIFTIVDINQIFNSIILWLLTIQICKRTNYLSTFSINPFAAKEQTVLERQFELD